MKQKSFMRIDAPADVIVDLQVYLVISLYMLKGTNTPIPKKMLESVEMLNQAMWQCMERKADNLKTIIKYKKENGADEN